MKNETIERIGLVIFQGMFCVLVFLFLGIGVWGAVLLIAELIQSI